MQKIFLAATDYIKKTEEIKCVQYFILLYFFIGIFLCFYAPTTGDEGDSIMHFMFPKYANKYPIHFFNQWAKPLFVFISFPFAKLGFTAFKCMNILFVTGALWLVYKLALYFNFKRAWLPVVILASTPMFLTKALSGLTEPMFALALVWSVYLLLVKKQLNFSLIVFSFLPFIRSEGLLIIGIILFYLLVNSVYNKIPLLFIGHVVYSILGYYFYHNFLWVFNTLSYTALSTSFGAGGEWLRFITKMNEIAGSANAILFYISILYFLILTLKWLRQQTTLLEQQELLLIFGCVVIFIMGHTLFWALGIFNSGGIFRVMVGIFPLMALTSARGLEYLFSCINNKIWQKWFVISSACLVFIYPFLGLDFSYRWQRDFDLNADQKAQIILVDFLKTKYPDFKTKNMYYEPCYIAMLLNHNIFVHRELFSLTKNNIIKLKKGDLVIWDDWFAPTIQNVNRLNLDTNRNLKIIDSFIVKNFWNTPRTTLLYETK